MILREIIESDQAPKAIGPYSQAVRTSGGRMLFLSGQIGLDPLTGQLVSDDLEQQTVRVMENLKAVLSAGGTDFQHVVRCTIFLVDMADFAKVNEIYGRCFQKEPPSRATVQVAGLPRGSKVEIDAIAVIGSSARKFGLGRYL